TVLSRGAEGGTSSSKVSSFFFSSRRRHTRSKRDWSSDVCSSDLFGRVVRKIREAKPDADFQLRPIGKRFWKFVWEVMLQAKVIRSEERRVGKECRSRWRAEH